MKIAVFWPNWIGDTVMATPAVRALRQHFASAHLIGVLKPNIAGVLEASAWMDEYVASAHVLTMVRHAIPNFQAKNILSR